jgi:hypothetical protein
MGCSLYYFPFVPFYLYTHLALIIHVFDKEGNGSVALWSASAHNGSFM